MSWADYSIAFRDTGRLGGTGCGSVRSRAASVASRRSDGPAPLPSNWMPPSDPNARAGCLSGIQYRPERYAEDSVHQVPPGGVLYSGHRQLPFMPGYSGYIPRKTAENVIGKTYALGNAEAARRGHPRGVLSGSASAPTLFASAGLATLSSPAAG
eukprot:TRINITY_DN103114_c0_g1_i1.p1 TRINITY_DN103114_c0_g1~~TRINITY_DN103114_c0_g1_i1.p1  ORF type:complete len:174 (-),score=18.08 TRINITY_DN103114_c0_g1_i1:18-482(-)